MPNTYQPKYNESRALIIGINKYTHASPLDIACADAESVSEVLVQDLGFSKANVTVLLDSQATKMEILKQFLSFESLSADDRLFVFFAGHGTTVAGQRGQVGYLVPVDGRLDDKSTLIRWDELTRNSEIIPAKHILFVMDACYSGLAIQRATSIGEQRFISDMLQRFSRQVITAGKADEKVADGGGPTGNNSIFTGHLLEGLQGKAANEKGVLTASYLMDYVYKKVGGDSRSHQTPHFGHFEGDGDFILRTPNNEHLNGGPDADFLVKPIIERPELLKDIPIVTIKPIFAEKNGYADPESDSFGKNEWSKKLGSYEDPYAENPFFRYASHWLSLVVEPISNQPVQLDIGNLAKMLPQNTLWGKNPHEQFAMPGRSITTFKSVIFSQPTRHASDKADECWERFLRIEAGGAMEYCHYVHIADLHRDKLKVFNYVNIIGVIWTFLFAAKRILQRASYESGIRYLVNLVEQRIPCLHNLPKDRERIKNFGEIHLIRNLSCLEDIHPE